MMSTSKHAKQMMVSAVAVGLVGMAVLPAAQAAPRSQSAVRATANEGVPTAYDSATGLGAQQPPGANANVDSIYFNSFVTAGGHRYAVNAVTQRRPNGQYMLDFGLNDLTAGWHKGYGATIPKSDYHWSTTGLDIHAPGLTWTGNAQHMSVQLDTPSGSLDLQFVPQGPVLNYAGTGSWSMLGDTQYEFAYPSMQTTGTLSVNGKTHKASGISWLDRQWGDVSLNDPSMRWTWMSVRLPNHDTLAIWDNVNSKSETSWATLVHPDGSYELAKVKPLADGVDRTWTSPHTGNTYATRWHVDIPSLKTHLTVSVDGPADQESVQGEDSGAYEVPATYTGTYHGKKATGEIYVEQVGDWKA